MRLPLAHLDGLDQQFWPRAAAANWLAAEVAKAKKRGVQKPFVLVDLAKFLPPWAGKAQPDEDEEMSKEAKDLAKALRGSADGPARADLLPWTPWHLAYDGRVSCKRARAPVGAACLPRARYAIAAAVLQQMSYATSLSHKHIVLQVAHNAHLSGRRALFSAGRAPAARLRAGTRS